MKEAISVKNASAINAPIESIFNSFPFRLLCEKVEELEDKLRGAIDFSIRDGVILSNMINEIKKGRYSR